MEKENCKKSFLEGERVYFIRRFNINTAEMSMFEEGKYAGDQPGWSAWDPHARIAVEGQDRASVIPYDRVFSVGDKAGLQQFAKSLYDSQLASSELMKKRLAASEEKTERIKAIYEAALAL